MSYHSISSCRSSGSMLPGGNIEMLVPLVKQVSPWSHTCSSRRLLTLICPGNPENFHDYVTCSLITPDLNTLEYYIWSIINSDTNQQIHMTCNLYNLCVITSKILQALNFLYLLSIHTQHRCFHCCTYPKCTLWKKNEQYIFQSIMCR